MPCEVINVVSQYGLHFDSPNLRLALTWNYCVEYMKNTPCGNS